MRELLEYINPASLDYQAWVNVGMALKEEGYDESVWDEWSRRDSARYHQGECASKWRTFNGASNPITAATIVQVAKEGGFKPALSGHELGWDDIIENDELVVIKEGWIEDEEIIEPKEWKPAEQLIKYLQVLFDSEDFVGYVTSSWEKDGKFLPSKGSFDRTAGQLIQELAKCGDDIESILGDYNQEAGAWIRFNPLDGKGVKNENVTEYRYCLVESDVGSIEQQNAIVRKLELPIAALVYSGGKSIHAIVKIDAANYDEYRLRVEYLYNVLSKNGLEVDRQNKNPSRLSRMPGVVRGDKKQFIIDTNIGKKDWAEWKEWIEGINDNLPDPESLADVWDNLPDLAPPLIDNVLRMGHKLLLAGPSKAGKSFCLIELCIAIAEGRKWLGWQCAKGESFICKLRVRPSQLFASFQGCI